MSNCNLNHLSKLRVYTVRYLQIGLFGFGTMLRVPMIFIKAALVVKGILLGNFSGVVDWQILIVDSTVFFPNLIEDLAVVIMDVFFLI